MNERIYVCHTFYHVYVACLKELHLLHVAAHGEEKAGAGSDALGRATLALSKMSNDFSGMLQRARACPLFEAVVEYDEKPDTFFEELAPLRKDTGSVVKNMINRMRFCRRFPKLQAPYVPVDFRKYREIYVFCDSDPIGYYLNANRIRYHAMEDGLDALKIFDAARYDNRGHFALKALMARLGLIFIQDGYAKYCIDMEVNDRSVLKYPMKKHIEVRRETLVEELTAQDKELLLTLFVDNIDALKERLRTQGDAPRVMILSEPLCDLETRARLFRDLVDEYRTMNGKQAVLLFKQHPRDTLDYAEVFSDKDVLLLGANYPMEMLRFIEGLHMDRVVSVLTVLDEMTFADERIFLGGDFLDRYEAPEIHRQNEQI